MAQKGFFEESLKRFCNEKFGAYSFVDGSYRDSRDAGSVEFSICADYNGYPPIQPVVSLEAIEDLSLMLGTCHITLRPSNRSSDDMFAEMSLNRPVIRFSAERVAFICPG